MTKRYKHKKLGVIATKFVEWYTVECETGDTNIPSIFIENSDDREEIKEVNVCGNGMVIGDNGIECVFGGNFKDIDSGIRFDNKLKALYQIRKRHAKNDGFMSGWVELEEEDKYSISYGHGYVKFIVGRDYTVQDNVFMPYFSTKEKAEQCIKECKPELNILFDIKE